jgi:hypothetical protein
MTFEHHIIGFAERFLSERTLQLIVLPAIADLQFEHTAGSLTQTAHRLAVLRAVCGGLQDDLARVSRGMLMLTLLPACYYIFLLVMCFDVLSIAISTSFLVVAALVLVLSLAPVMACFWPERPPVRSAD